jgi:outer membrane protein OmpA-like peptidoglycan-associated protein
MRSFKTVLAAAAIAAVPSLAHAQWYVGVDAGASFLEDSKNSGSGQNLKTSYDTGWLTQGLVGYAFGPVRVEGEIAYRDNGVDKVGGAKGHGNANALSTMVNGVYEFMPDSSFHPFVGVGIGAANVDASKVSRNGTDVYKGDDWAFAYQAFAGLGYDVTRDVELKTQYRYFSTLDYDTKSIPGGTKLSGEYHDHAVLLGFVYKFNPPAPAPVPVAAPAPAPAPIPAPAKPVPVKPAQVQKNFIVFFDFDKALITPEATAIIQQAAAAVRANSATRIDLTGHTDLAGSEKYNLALSVKRGEAVKARLVQLGIPADQIVVVGKGKSTPLVKTPDGVREPQNRRVEIVLP